jgi:hypothetical protein
MALQNDGLRRPPPWISPAAGKPDREVRQVIVVQRPRVPASLNPNTLLLLSGKGANNSTAILDSSYYGRGITINGNTKITTSVADPFGTSEGVLDFDGNGDVLQVAYTSNLDLTTPYTLEFFFRRTTTANSGLFGKGGGVSGWNSTNGIEITIYIFDGLLTVQRYISGQDVFSSIDTKTTLPPAINTWAHFATSYDGTTVRYFLDGTAFANGTAQPIKPQTSNIYTVGAHIPLTAGTPLFHLGQIAQFQQRVGAIYVANFTPPSGPFIP